MAAQGSGDGRRASGLRARRLGLWTQTPTPLRPVAGGASGRAGSGGRDGAPGGALGADGVPDPEGGLGLGEARADAVVGLEALVGLLLLVLADDLVLGVGAAAVDHVEARLALHLDAVADARVVGEAAGEAPGSEAAGDDDRAGDRCDLLALALALAGRGRHGRGRELLLLVRAPLLVGLAGLSGRLDVRSGLGHVDLLGGGCASRHTLPDTART